MTEPEKRSTMVPFDAKTQKAIAPHDKRFSLFETNARRAGAEFFGYVFLMGRELELIAHELPGAFKAWLEKREWHESKSTRYREFFRLAEPKVLAALAAPTVGAANPGNAAAVAGLQAKNGKLSSKAVPAIVAAIQNVMDGKTMMAFMRDQKLLSAPKPDGGFRPNAEMLEAWLKQHHPKLCGKSYDELPPDIQEAFKAQYDPGRLTPEEEAQITREDFAERTTWMDRFVAEKEYGLAYGPEHLDELIARQKSVHDFNQALLTYIAALRRASVQNQNQRNPVNPVNPVKKTPVVVSA